MGIGDEGFVYFWVCLVYLLFEGVIKVDKIGVLVKVGGMFVVVLVDWVNLFGVLEFLVVIKGEGV